MNSALLLVFIGGGTGSVIRYLIGREFNPPQSISLPIGTLMINLLGSFIIGILWGISEKTSSQNSSIQLLLVTGFCGGFTTFSAFSQESLTFIKTGNWNNAIVYISCTLIAGIFLTATGFKIANNL
ncbi:MAG: fluoride efflux transporter CrcB [Bacteroidota bacterium]|jgi:CrcB protein|nr:fluoride efflux transporter CrcB [Terrimonas sp.]